MVYNFDKYYLIYNGKEYSSDNIPGLKKDIKSGLIPKPNTNEKVFMINFSQSNTKPLIVVIGQYTLTPKGALVMKDDDISQSIVMDNNTFNKTILNKIIKAFKNHEIDYTNSSMSYSKINKQPVNKGNVMKASSDITHINGKRHVNTDMVMQTNLTKKEKRALHKSILKAVSDHLKGSGLHIPLHGNYTSSLIFHEMGKYISPKDRKLMEKLIAKTTPPPPPPVHSGAISSPSLAVIPPINYEDVSKEEREEHMRRIKELNDSDSETDEEHEEHMRRIKELNDSESDTSSDEYDSDMEGHGIANKKYSKHLKRRVGRPRKHKIGKGFDFNKDILYKAASVLVPGAGSLLGKGTGRPRGRPRKIVC
jgi:hypothetical protein